MKRLAHMFKKVGEQFTYEQLIVKRFKQLNVY